LDIDRFIAANSPSWERLDGLTHRAQRGVSRLAPDDLTELVELYQRTSSHLSYAQTYFSDPGLSVRLSQRVAAAGAVIYGTHPRTLRGFVHFFTATLPAALWHLRRYVLISAVLTFGPALVMGAWLAHSPRAVEATAPAALRQAYVQHDFRAYYSSEPAAAFATTVYTNNVRVAIVAFAAGIIVCLPTAYILIINGGNLGVAAGLFAAAGQSSKFWGLVLPHGLIELTSVIIAGAAGLRLGWTIVDPGDRPRLTALAEEGRRAVVVVFGTVFTLLIAGTIEGFVTGSTLPTAVRVGIGVIVEVAFLTYAVLLGRAAAARGETGAIGETERNWARPEPLQPGSGLHPQVGVG
jgi:uncharacterized membrane protein SpoIIM required for sporulation